MNPVVRRALPWLALGCLVLLALLLGPQLLLRGRGTTPPSEYEVVFPSASTFEGGIPGFVEGQTFAAFLAPVDPTAGSTVPELTVGAVDPLGHPVVLSDRLRVQTSDGTIQVEGAVDELFGEQTGTWRLLLVLSPANSSPATKLISRHGWEIKARPDGTVDWPGNHRVMIRSIVVN